MFADRTKLIMAAVIALSLTLCGTAFTAQKVRANTPPAAAFSAPSLVCVKDTVAFDAGATKDDTQTDLTYKWDFGDGTRGEGKQVTHVYEKGGNYNVTLTVDDNSGTAGNLDTVQKTVRVNTAPVANAGRDITLCLRSPDEEYKVMFDGFASRDPDGNTLTYMWEFGDGMAGQGAKVTHVYKTGGEYVATLTVDDGSRLACSSDTDSVKVNLNRAPVAVAGSDMKVCAGKAVTFDGSSSRTEGGEILTYTWSFGDGEKVTGKVVNHTYDKSGNYTVLLTVDDGRGTMCSTATDAISVTVNSRPSADLKKVADTCVGKKVHFNAAGSKDPDGDKLTYMWKFGDGTKTEGRSRISHTYEKGGNYNVSVTVDDGKDLPCSTASEAVRLKVNTPPVAKMAIAKDCCVGMEQKFSAAGSSDPDGDQLTCMWKFGDGTTAQGSDVTHVYTKPGTYKVTLKVDDGSGTEGSSDLVVDHIKVNAKPAAGIKTR